MEMQDVPWRELAATPVLAFALKMLYDAVYKKIPSGFRSIRMTMAQHDAAAVDRHSEHMQAQEKFFRKLLKHTKRCAKADDLGTHRPRRQTKRRRRQARGPDPPP